MIRVSEPSAAPPPVVKTRLQRKVYETLAVLSIPFLRVDTDEAVTMEDCEAINARLDVEVVKTLFLCNRQKTAYYLFVTVGDKPFRTKDVSAALGVTRLSFASADAMERQLGTVVGAATIFSILLESAAEVRLVIDEDVVGQEWYGCSDGTTTGYLKLKTDRVIQDFLTYAGRRAYFVQV
jgi:Ala-tRNA(Pro) deacylase